ncbi:MAG: glycosyltransferase, partial [bacterium]
LDWTRYATPPDRALLRELDDGHVNILFVGRGVPNKRIDDLLQAVATLRYGIEPQARLIHVGSYAGTERYRVVLEARARELGLRDTLFLGAIPQAGLNACYRAAQVFLCMSEHEGVCIPLLEAMRFDLPVAARACAAVPETLDGAGVLFAEPDYPVIAEVLARLARPGELRDGVLAAQRARLARYQALDLGAELRRHLAPLL